MGIRESLIRWVDSYQGGLSDEDSDLKVRKLSRNDLVRCIPFIGIHLGVERQWGLGNMARSIN